MAIPMLVEGVDRSTLEPVARRALGETTARIVDWEVRQVHGGIVGPATGASAIFRVTGTARDADGVVRWSVILKASRVAKVEASYHPWLWNSEPFAYESGLLEDLPGDVAAPRCFGVDQKAEDLYWIWLEDVVEEVGPDWPLERYALAARHLGQFNGAYLVSRPLPDSPLLSHGFYRAWIRLVRQMLAGFPVCLQGNPDNPLVRRACPPDLAEGVLRLWDDLPDFLDTLDQLPQTLCHLDAFRRNLIARRTRDGRDQTVAVDWPTAGLAAVGVETAPMIQLALMLYESFLSRDTSAVEEFEASVFESYLAGLRDVGWTGDGRMARLGHLIGVALRTGSMPAGACLLLDPAWREERERTTGHSAVEDADRFAAMGKLGLWAADRARELLPLVARPMAA